MADSSRSYQRKMGPYGGPPKVDHTYRDFSRYLQKGGEVVQHKKSGSNFPAKLHQMLSDPELSCIISWMPHGRAFKIRNKDLLMSRAVPKYFGQTKFQSFTRQLSGWGFKRLCRPGSDVGCYYHECFLRGLPRITELMRRAPSNHGRLASFPEGEPDFYRISNLYPLPPDDSGCPRTASQADAAPTAISSSATIGQAHDSLMPIVHSYPYQNSGSATNMLGTLMSDLHQHHEMTSRSNDNQAYSLKASPAKEATESALKSDYSSKPIVTRQADAASSTMYASQSASNIQARGWSDQAQSTMWQNMAIPPQDYTPRLSAVALAAATNENWPSMLMPTLRPSSITGAQNEMMHTAHANLSDIPSTSMPCVHSHEKNAELKFAASISEAERAGLASRKRSSSDTDQSLLGIADYSSSDVCAVMKDLASYHVPNISISRDQSAQESSAASTFPVEPAAASTFLTNQASSQYSRWSLPGPHSNIGSTYFSNEPSTEIPLSTATTFQGAPIAASNSRNSQLSFQNLHAFQSSIYNTDQNNFAYSSGPTEYTSTETTTSNDSNHQFQNTQGQLKSSPQDLEDAKPSSDRSSFEDEMSAFLDKMM